MRARMILGWLVLLTMVAAIGYAQAPPAAAVPATPAATAQLPMRPLSLAEALETARANNPAYLTSVSDRGPAATQSLASAAALITPTVTLQGGAGWNQRGNYNLQGISFDTPRGRGSEWAVNFGYTLSGTTIANRGLAAAQLRAADQDIASSRTVLETSVEQEYINLLEARAQAELVQHQVAQAQELLNLAQAQFDVGQKTIIDVKQAQVTKGNADVALLQAQQNVQIEVLKVYQLMGVPAPVGVEVVPTDTFAVTQPAWRQDSLVTLALVSNPVLMALRARADGARWNTRAAYSTYLPTLRLSASYGRYQQTTWNQAVDTATHLPFGPDSIVERTNGINPPWNFQIGLSIPIFDGFSRNSQISQMRAAERDLQLNIRAQELAVRANVSGAYTGLVYAFNKIAVQAANRAAADDALSLAEQQYRVGSGSIIQLTQAQVTSEQAGVSYINSVYDYHKAVAALEQAVGRPLR